MSLNLHRSQGFLQLLWLLLLLPGLCAANRAYAGQNDVEAESARIWVGKKAEAFTLPGIDGKPVNLARTLGKKPVVLIFYRGVW